MGAKRLFHNGAAGVSPVPTKGTQARNTTLLCKSKPSSKQRRIAVVITCEHGGNRVPRRYARLFAPHQALLESHRGWDPGSLDMARAFARGFDAPLIASTTTRLLVELNRSPHHRSLFSTITRDLPDAEKAEIWRRWYDPHRRRVVEEIQRSLSRADVVLHLAMHTFTPVFDGVTRTTDIGLLFDPSRPLEKRLCTAWQHALREARPDLTIHRNQPYRGVSDGLGTALRRDWPASRYAAMELEVNHRFAIGPAPPWRQLIRTLVHTCHEAINSM